MDNLFQTSLFAGVTVSLVAYLIGMLLKKKFKGWDLVLEYAVAAVAISISWSRYFCIMMSDIGHPLPIELTACPSDNPRHEFPHGKIGICVS